MPLRLVPLFVLAAFLFFVRVANAEDPPTPRPGETQTPSASPARNNARMATRLPTPLPGGKMFPGWMTPPATGPTQADAGAVLYYYRCMACHGDRGQGLTVEWRAQWDVEHQSCARSGCHGSRYPPEGFTFPKNFAPAIIGTNALTKYKNAQELYDFVSARMPFQAPGSLSRDEYWELVAYLMRERGVSVTRVDGSNASRVALQPVSLPEGAMLPVLSGLLLAGGAALGLALRRMAKK